jgi:hypothetical protein
MRIILAALFGVSLVVGLAMPTGTQAYEKARYNKKKTQKHYRHARPPSRDSTNRSDYYEHLADKLPVGSSRWFEQMEREGRFGRRDN